jgi:hypothetical protein
MQSIWEVHLDQRVMPEELIARYWIDVGGKRAEPIDNQLGSNTELVQ